MEALPTPHLGQEKEAHETALHDDGYEEYSRFGHGDVNLTWSKNRKNKIEHEPEVM